MAKKVIDPDVQAEAAETVEAIKPEKPSKEAKKEPKFLLYEVWKMEWKGIGDNRELVKVNVKKTVKILKEHADILNEQVENTLLKYVRKEA